MLDCAGRKTGARINRDEAHATGTWHGAVHCLIAFPSEGRFSVLFQLRSREKKIAPGKFDVSVGGHYAAGEGPELAGPREIREELGLDVSFPSLLPLGKRIFLFCPSPSVREQEFQDIYLLPLDGFPERLSLQKSEVDGVLQMDVEQGCGLFQGEVPVLECLLIRNNGSREHAAVRPDDFVPSIDGYYLKLLQLVRRYFHGERQGLVV